MDSKYQFSNHVNEVIQKRELQANWVLETIEHYDYKNESSKVEVHYFKRIKDRDNRCLKVVLNPVFNKIITAYFDRKATKKDVKNENKL